MRLRLLRPLILRRRLLLRLSAPLRVREGWAHGRRVRVRVRELPRGSIISVLGPLNIMSEQSVEVGHLARGAQSEQSSKSL